MNFDDATFAEGGVPSLPVQPLIDCFPIIDSWRSETLRNPEERDIAAAVPKVAGSSILLDDAKGVPFLEFLALGFLLYVGRLDLPQLYVNLVSCRDASGKFNPRKTVLVLNAFDKAAGLDVLSIMVTIIVSKLHQSSSCAHSLLAAVLLSMQQGAQDRSYSSRCG
ncbi:STYKc [Musa troglodytarum]|uniref:STYKc n=1 Tax=Musa troglodytarum TaxID=320322 RepID=A0A9E7FX79_9LILI|nr:STYKc [Musa troglodytarum]